MLILQHLPRAALKDPTLTFGHLSVVTSAHLLLSNNLLLVPSCKTDIVQSSFVSFVEYDDYFWIANHSTPEEYC